MYWLSFAQIVIGLVIYQTGQKAVSKSISSFEFIAMSYGVGFILCAAIALGFRLFQPVERLPEASITSSQVLLCALIVGVGATMIEIGYFLGYRSGWTLSELPVLVMIAGTVGLATIGSIWFQESLSGSRIFGLLLCGIGLFLVLKK